jgi:superfamily II DNA or RNA helicase
MKRLRELNNDKIPTIVFACSVKHGQLLASMLSLEGIPNALVIGDMLPNDRVAAISSFKDRNNPINILINYEVLTTGFDATNIKCVFIARPTQSVVLYSQMLGRGLRGPQMGGNEECLLIDVKDNLEKFNEKLAFSHFDNYWKG